MILKTDMFPYQKEAFDKLIGLKVGALYMEQGTGKTLVTLYMIKDRLDKGKIDKVLWLCPCSVKSDLYLNISSHADDWEDKITIMGIQSLSSSSEEINKAIRLADERTFIIVDESILIKNPKAKRTERIIMLSKKCKYRLILNGTPISKNEADLFSQWLVLDWRILGFRSFSGFSRAHVLWDDKIPYKIKAVVNVEELMKKIAPYTYQIKKSECLRLPDKRQINTYTHMTDNQEDHYNEIGKTLFDRIDPEKPTTIYLFFTALQKILSGEEVKLVGNGLTSSPMFEEPEDNPRVKDLLHLLKTRIHGKCIIFCKYIREIEELHKLIPNSVTFYGKDSLKKRAENIKKFRDSADVLIANKSCAGYGLNLQFCSDVIFYTNDFDYATRAQAEDRVYRIGQTKDVRIFDMRCKGTVDDHILNCLERKESLSDYVKNNLQELKKYFKGVDKENEDECVPSLKKAN